MKLKFKLDGLNELTQSLGELKKATARRVVERALKNAAEPIRKAAKDNAPVATGKLKKSIGTRIKRGNAGNKAYARAKASGATDAEAAKAARLGNREAGGQGMTATVSVGTEVPYAHLVEYGTVGVDGKPNPAQPFLVPAFHANQRKAAASLGEEIGKEIEKAARRAAKRKAKP